MPPISSPFLTAMKELAVFLGKKMDAITTAVKGLDTKESIDLSPVVRAVEQLKSVVANQKTPEFSGSVKVDQTAVKTAIQGVTDQLKKLEFPKTDLKMMEAKMDKLHTLLEKDTQKFSTLADSINALAKGLDIKIPSTLKIDDKQFQALSNAGSSHVGTGTTPLNMATRVTNTTVTATSASVQYTYTFPSGTVGWLIKLRDQGTLGYYSWTTGKLPTSGTGTTYMTIPQNFLRSQENVEYAGKTIYLGAEAASQTFEIEVFQR